MTATTEEEVEVETLSSGGEDEQVEVEDPFAVRRQELKELRAKVVALRKAAKNSDKKQKKAALEEITALEAEMESRRVALDADEKQAAAAALVMERIRETEKAAAAKTKRLAKKNARLEDDARRREEAEMAAAQMPQLARLERESFEKILAPASLQVHSIEPDGNCLFNALAHQLRVRHDRDLTGQQLRMMAVEHIAANPDKYAAFLDESIDEYCAKLASDLWGGHLELDALGEVLGTPIAVYQADAEPIRFGSDADADADADKDTDTDAGRPLCIAFQKYAYSLGEHYDSLVDIGRS